MGKNPNTIFKEIYRKAKHRQEAIVSTGNTNDTIKMSNQDKCLYVPYKEVIKEFLMEGYPEQRAIKHIDQWIDYDLIFVRYSDGYKYIGLTQDVI